MENSERKFEGQWKQAFRGAEALPPASVWLSIENSLANLENDSNKRRVVYYRRLAASLLLICVASVTTTYLTWKDSSSESQLVSQSTKPAPSSAGTSDTKEGSPAYAKSFGGQAETRNHDGSLAKTGKAVPTVTEVTAQNSIAQDITTDSAVVDDSSVAIAQAEEQPQPQVQDPPLTEEEEKALVKRLLGGDEDKTVVEKKSVHRPSWASLGLAGGSFAPYPSSGTSSSSYNVAYAMDQSALASSQRVAQPKGPSTGSSYSVGMMVGKQFGRRWMIQTGLNYMMQRIDYESNVVLSTVAGQKAFQLSAADGNSTSYTYSSIYSINSASEYISLPMQVGYIFLDRKAGFILHAGLSTDFFIRNQLSDPTGTYGTYSQSGSDGIFRAVSWSGLGSAEFSYRLADQYRLSLVPGIRYSLTNTIKDESGPSQPLIFDVGLRFRYIFK